MINVSNDVGDFRLRRGCYLVQYLYHGLAIEPESRETAPEAWSEPNDMLVQKLY